MKLSKVYQNLDHILLPRESSAGNTCIPYVLEKPGFCPYVPHMPGVCLYEPHQVSLTKIATIIKA